MTGRLRRWAIAMTISVGACAAINADVARADSRESVNLGAAISPEMLLPVQVANQKGCFAEHGIDFHFLPLGGSQTRDALAAGQINFALFHVAPIWIAAEKGLPFKFVSMFYTKEIFGMLTGSAMRSRVSSVSSLRGLQGLTAVPGSASYAATTFFLKRNDLDPNKDVQMTYVTSTDPKIWLNAIETQKVQFLGGVWEPVFSTAIRSGIGFSSFDPADEKQHTAVYGGDVSTLGLVTTTNLISTNRALVKKVVDCVNVGLTDIPKESDDDLVQIMLADGTVKIDREDLKQVIHRIRGNYEPDGRPSKSKYERGVAAYLKAGYLKRDVPYEAVIDPSFTGTAP
jgi:ABC-type nitrate/sulfonate/bicarbonate transport system substrate-binding protein